MRLPDPGSGPVEYTEDQEEHITLRMMWLILVGWWLSVLWVIAAWACMLTYVGTPAGLRMLGSVHHVVALKRPRATSLDLVDDTIWSMHQKTVPQRPPLVRLLYALVVGWWLSLLWSLLAWSQSLRLQNGTNAVVMFMRLPAIISLRRY